MLVATVAGTCMPSSSYIPFWVNITKMSYVVDDAFSWEWDDMFVVCGKTLLVSREQLQWRWGCCMGCVDTAHTEVGVVVGCSWG